MLFRQSLPLTSGLKYQLSLTMTYDEGSPIIPVTTIWGFQGVPKIKVAGFSDQDMFRWKQVYRKGLSSSVSSGQFPLLYFIK
jgi:hypothetical protein